MEAFEAPTIFHITINFFWRFFFIYLFKLNFFLKRINPTILYLSRLPSYSPNAEELSLSL